RRSARATPADTAAAGGVASSRCQAARPRLHEVLQGRELGSKLPRARGGQSVRPPRSAFHHRLDQTCAFEPGDRAVERSWAQPPTRDHVNVLLDRVAVLVDFVMDNQYT